MPLKQPQADITLRIRAGSVSRNEASDEETNGGGELSPRTDGGGRGAGRRNTRPAFEPRPIHAIRGTTEPRKIVNDHRRAGHANFAAHGFIVHLERLMCAGLMMFARPMMVAVTVLVLVVAFIQWSGVIRMPLFAITLDSSKKMYRTREMFANLQPSPAGGRDDES